MIWITGTGYGICLRRNLIIVFFTVNHLHAIPRNGHVMQGGRRRPLHIRQAAAAATQKMGHPRPASSKALETSHLRTVMQGQATPPAVALLPSMQRKQQQAGSTISHTNNFL
jgi:hypothetical protein